MNAETALPTTGSGPRGQVLDRLLDLGRRRALPGQPAPDWSSSSTLAAAAIAARAASRSSVPTGRGWSGPRAASRSLRDRTPGPGPFPGLGPSQYSINVLTYFVRRTDGRMIMVSCSSGCIQLGLLAVLGWIWLGRRPDADRFAAAQGLDHRRPRRLPLVQTALRLTYLRPGRSERSPVASRSVLIAWGLGSSCGALLRDPRARRRNDGRHRVAQHPRRAGARLRAPGVAHRREPWPTTPRIARPGRSRSPPSRARRARRWVAIDRTGRARRLRGGILVSRRPPCSCVPLRPPAPTPRRGGAARRGGSDVDDALRATRCARSTTRCSASSCCGIVLAGAHADALTRGTLGRGAATRDTSSSGAPARQHVASPSDTGLRRARATRTAPIRVFWIEADGSSTNRPLRVDGDVHSTTPGRLTASGAVFGWCQPPRRHRARSSSGSARRARGDGGRREAAHPKATRARAAGRAGGRPSEVARDRHRRHGVRGPAVRADPRAGRAHDRRRRPRARRAGSRRSSSSPTTCSSRRGPSRARTRSSNARGWS